MTDNDDKTAMSSSLADLQTYQLIEPYPGFKPIGKIVNIEVQPIKDNGEACEPCNAGEEDFWSVYVRYDPNQKSGFGGVDCVADCSDLTGAEKLADLLAGLLGVEVV